MIKETDYPEDGGSVFFQNFDTYLYIRFSIRPFIHPFDLLIHLPIYIYIYFPTCL